MFTGYYTRELYNTIRQTLVDYGNQDSLDYRYAYTMVAKGDAYSAVKNVVGRMSGVLWYEHYAPKISRTIGNTWTITLCRLKCQSTIKCYWTISSQ